MEASLIAFAALVIIDIAVAALVIIDMLTIQFGTDTRGGFHR
jgi:hypothetical protein